MGRTAKKTEEPLQIEESASETDLTLYANEAPSNRQEKREAELDALRARVAVEINEKFTAEFGFEIFITTEVSRFDVEDEDGESTYIENAITHLRNYFYDNAATLEDLQALAEQDFIQVTENLAFSFYDVETEYGTVENIFNHVSAWHEANLRPINEEVTSTVLSELGLHVRLRPYTAAVDGDINAYSTNAANVVKAVYLGIASGMIEGGVEAIPTETGKVVAITSCATKGGELVEPNENWLVDLYRQPARYTSEGGYAEAITKAIPLARTILATRYGVTLPGANPYVPAGAPSTSDETIES